MTCYWEVKLEVFTGVRLEIGVATRRSIYRGGCDKDEVCAAGVSCGLASERSLVYSFFCSLLERGRGTNLLFRGKGPRGENFRVEPTRDPETSEISGAIALFTMRAQQLSRDSSARVFFSLARYHREYPRRLIGPLLSRPTRPLADRHMRLPQPLLAAAAPPPPPFHWLNATPAAVLGVRLLRACLPWGPRAGLRLQAQGRRRARRAAQHRR